VTCHCMLQVSALHAVQTPAKTVLFMDRKDLDTSFLAFSWGSQWVKNSMAYAEEYTLSTGQYRPLNTRTNLFCSAGFFLPNGTFVSSARVDGDRRRAQVDAPFSSCTDNKCDFSLSGQCSSFKKKNNVLTVVFRVYFRRRSMRLFPFCIMTQGRILDTKVQYCM